MTQQQLRPILIIDDMQDIRHQMISELNPPISPQERMVALVSGKPMNSHHHFKIDEAGQGEDGVALALKNKYDVIICDMRMPPGIDGAETISRIRAGGCTCPIIVCTGFSDHSESSLKEANLGPLQIIFKPYPTNAIINAIKEAVAC